MLKQTTKEARENKEIGAELGGEKKRLATATKHGKASTHDEKRTQHQTSNNTGAGQQEKRR